MHLGAMVLLSTLLLNSHAAAPGELQDELKHGSRVRLSATQLTFGELLQQIENQTGNRIKLSGKVSDVDEVLARQVKLRPQESWSFWSLVEVISKETGYTFADNRGQMLRLALPAPDASDRRFGAYMPIGATVEEGAFRLTPVVRLNGDVRSLWIHVQAEPRFGAIDFQRWRLDLTSQQGKRRFDSGADGEARQSDQIAGTWLLRCFKGGVRTGKARLKFRVKTRLCAQWQEVTTDQPLNAMTRTWQNVGEGGSLRVVSVSSDKDLHTIEVQLKKLELERRRFLPIVDLLTAGGDRVEGVVGGEVKRQEAKLTVRFPVEEVGEKIGSGKLIVRQLGADEDVQVPVFPSLIELGQSTLHVRGERFRGRHLEVLLEATGFPLPMRSLSIVDAKNVVTRASGARPVSRGASRRGSKTGANWMVTFSPGRRGRDARTYRLRVPKPGELVAHTFETRLKVQIDP